MKSYFRRLQEKWQVGTRSLILILIVFALTGTVTAWITSSITTWMDLSRSGLNYWVG